MSLVDALRAKVSKVVKFKYKSIMNYVNVNGGNGILVIYSLKKKERGTHPFLCKYKFKLKYIMSLADIFRAATICEGRPKTKKTWFEICLRKQP